ncbi:alpha/beta fold hydrolase, partial [Nocardia sp. NPDC051052]|uniref:alpha/beta fold hydrolase n=1 Tax=Nocardia sp. NPDC051052 TaxID=3364322 RepID=UPI00379D2D7E
MGRSKASAWPRSDPRCASGLKYHCCRCVRLLSLRAPYCRPTAFCAPAAEGNRRLGASGSSHPLPSTTIFRPARRSRAAARRDCWRSGPTPVPVPLGVERVIAVGHSSGGAVATALAEQRPDLVAAV